MKKQMYSFETEEPAINLTPLIDVVFVILIMFILIAPLLEIDRIELAKAGVSPEKGLPAQEKSLVSIHVHKDNSIYFNNQKVTIEQLALSLRKSKENTPSARPQLFHDKQAHFGTYQQIKNVLEDAGFDQLDVIVKPG